MVRSTLEQAPLTFGAPAFVRGTLETAPSAVGAPAFVHRTLEQAPLAVGSAVGAPAFVRGTLEPAALAVGAPVAVRGTLERAPLAVGSVRDEFAVDTRSPVGASLIARLNAPRTPTARPAGAVAGDCTSIRLIGSSPWSSTPGIPPSYVPDKRGRA